MNAAFKQFKLALSKSKPEKTIDGFFKFRSGHFQELASLITVQLMLDFINDKDEKAHAQAAKQLCDILLARKPAKIDYQYEFTCEFEFYTRDEEGQEVCQGLEDFIDEFFRNPDPKELAPNIKKFAKEMVEYYGEDKTLARRLKKRWSIITAKMKTAANRQVAAAKAKAPAKPRAKALAEPKAPAKPRAKKQQ